MTETSKSGAANDDGDSTAYGGATPDSEPIEAEFQDVDPVATGSNPSGPGWTGAMALAVLAALGGSVGGTFGARLLGGPALGPAAPAEIEALRGETREAGETLIAETAALSGRLEATDARLSETAEAVAGVRESLAALDDDLERVDRVATFERRLSALESARDAAGEDTSPSEVALGALSGRLETLETEVTALARATDALAAATDGLDANRIGTALSGLEADVASLSAQAAAIGEAGPADAQLTADLALALADITRAAAAGEGFAGPHADLAAAIPDNRDVIALAPHAAAGVATPDQLAQQFSALAEEARAADPREPEGGLGLAERLFGDQIKVRRDGEVSVADQLALAETALANGDVSSALAATDALPPQVLDALAPWRTAAEARLATDAALDGLRQVLAAGITPPAAEAQP